MLYVLVIGIIWISHSAYEKIYLTTSVHLMENTVSSPKRSIEQVTLSDVRSLFNDSLPNGGLVHESDIFEWYPNLTRLEAQARNIFTDHSQTASSNRMNYELSSVLPLLREFLDFRPKRCKHTVYEAFKLPTASIIIGLRNETWSTLLRTIFGVFHYTPATVLQEIILVDSYNQTSRSYAEFLLKIPKVKLLHRRGKKVSRAEAVKVAKGDTLVFMNSNVWVGKHWLEPLLWELSKDPKLLVQPNVDEIDTKTLQPRRNGVPRATRWEMRYDLSIQKGFLPDDTPLNLKTMSYNSAAIYGSVWAVQRKFFMKIGSLDSSLQGSEAENAEISIRYWACDGSIKLVHCSHVGYLRQRRKTSRNYNNLKRVAKLWLSDDKLHLFKALIKEPLNFTADEEESMDFRRSALHEGGCADFMSYLEYAQPQLKIPPQNAKAFGHISKSDRSSCMTSRMDKIVMTDCSTSNKQFVITFQKRFQREDDSLCIAIDDDKLILRSCDDFDKDQMGWEFVPSSHENGQILFRDKCLWTEKGDSKELLLMPCERIPKGHSWNVTYFFKKPWY